jgi:hypothetical protein
MTHRVEDFRDEDYKTSIREYYEFKFDRADRTYTLDICEIRYDGE